MAGIDTPEMQQSHRAVGGRESRNKTVQYTYDNCNRLLTKTDIAEENTTSNQTEYTYDICGNLINDGETVYIYDDFNRLSQVEKQQAKALYTIMMAKDFVQK